MNWRKETNRFVLEQGDTDIGAIYPPAAGGRMWRWRVWVTVRGRVVNGREPSEAQARRNVEQRFQAFLSAARLMPAGGDA